MWIPVCGPGGVLLVATAGFSRTVVAARGLGAGHALRGVVSARGGARGMRRAPVPAALDLRESGKRKQDRSESRQKSREGGRAQPHAHRTLRFRVGSSGHNLLPALGRKRQFGINSRRADA